MHTRCVPELPEVHALAADLDGRLRGRVLDRFDVTSFAALKTFDPPVSALHGMLVAGVARHGKFLDISAVPREGEAGEPLHLIEALAGRVADTCLAAPQVDKVEVTVHKPEAPIEADVADVAVTLTRSKKQ